MLLRPTMLNFYVFTLLILLAMYPKILINGKSLKQLIFGFRQGVVTETIKGVLSVDSYTIHFYSCNDDEVRTLPLHQGKPSRTVNFASKLFNKLYFLSDNEKYVITFDPPQMLVYDQNDNIVAEIDGKLF